uniref:DUF4371 domain-containing protein n=1 Tax=Anoplophora glabripennis TaxID=217634 RepID=V5I8S8_ANOGL
MVLVFRYELNGNVFERFWGFSNPEGQNADQLSECILRQLVEPVLQNCPNKLIAQTYDGAAVMRRHLGGVNVKIREKYKNAHYIFCTARLINLINYTATQKKKSSLYFSGDICYL